MRIPLQEIGFRDSEYERPNQHWVCGWTNAGDPCKHGPDGDGRCTAFLQATCSPIKERDSWLCTRPEAFGGPCDNGPKPDGSCCCPKPEHMVCQPTRSIRAKRGRLVLLATAFAFGFLVLMLGGPWRLGFVNPGELSSVHLAIQSEDGRENCIACHPAGGAGPSAWLQIALNQADGNMHDDRDVGCLTCHFNDDLLSRDNAMMVHGVAASELANLTAESGTKDTIEAGSGAGELGATTGRLMLANLVSGPVVSATGEIACASCHQEHKGAKHDLSLMSDAQCQACHHRQFESFNDGHPRFTEVPRQSSGISFDHVKHEVRFESGQLICADCHRPDSLGRWMVVRSFEYSCEGCHEQGSIDHHGDAIRKNPLLVLQLPELEFEDQVYWPTDQAYGEFLTPMMAILLAGDDEALPLIGEIYAEGGAAGDLYEWLVETEDNDEPELRAELAAALKRLVADLADHSKDGTRARSERIARSFGASSEDQHVRNLATELASANFVMQSFKQRYLPQLDEDLAGEEVSADDDELSEVAWMTSASMSGWRADSEEGTVSYRPLMHADGLLKHWIDALKVHSSKKLSAEDRSDEASVVRSNLRKYLYAELKSDFNACFKCHTQGNSDINWSAAGRSSGSSGYAKFNHSPHIAMLPDQNDCMTCHVLNTASENASDLSMPRGFLPHRNERCESCHAPGRANNTCLNCHQYHETRP